MNKIVKIDLEDYINLLEKAKAYDELVTPAKWVISSTNTEPKGEESDSFNDPFKEY